MAITPKQALTILENIKREAPGKEIPVAVANTFALEAPAWALAAMSRDSKIIAELKKTNAVLKALMKHLQVDVSALNIEAPAEPEAASEGEAEAAPPTGAPANVNIEELKGEALEAYMNAATEGLPPNQNAPAPMPMPPPVSPAGEYADVPVPSDLQAPPPATAVAAAAARKPAGRPAAPPKA